jgi:hypothetical protein
VASKRRFRAEVRDARGGGHLVEVPNDVVNALGGRGRTPVRASFNGIPYRGSIVSMGGSFVLGVQKAILGEAGASAGDTLDVVVELDAAPREVEVPDDLRNELDRRKTLRAAWDRSSYSHRREYAAAITEAKRPETRRRRIEKTLQALAERSKSG